MAKAIAQSDFVGTVGPSGHSVVDYSKFDKLEIDDETEADDAKRERARLRHSLIQQRYAMKAAQMRGEGYSEPEIDVNQRLIDAGFEPDDVEPDDASSSEDDSDIESIPLFWKKLPKNWKENETIRAMQSLKDGASGRARRGHEGAGQRVVQKSARGEAYWHALAHVPAQRLALLHNRFELRA